MDLMGTMGDGDRDETVLALACVASMEQSRAERVVYLISSCWFLRQKPCWSDSSGSRLASI